MPVEEAFGLEDSLFENVEYVPIYVPTYAGLKPYIEADILLLKAPFRENPPKIFDARKLKEALQPHVEGPIKKRKNVEPHIHEYLLPEGKLSGQI